LFGRLSILTRRLKGRNMKRVVTLHCLPAPLEGANLGEKRGLKARLRRTITPDVKKFFDEVDDFVVHTKTHEEALRYLVPSRKIHRCPHPALPPEGEEVF